MTILSKVISVAVGIGAIGGGVGLGVHLYNAPTIMSKLISEGFDTNITEWKTLLDAHNLVTEEDVFKTTGNEEKNEEWLKNKCREALNRGDKDNKNYLLARQWCVKETTIEAVFDKENSKHKLLSTLTTDTQKDNDAWIAKINNLKNNEQAKTALNVQLNNDQAANIIKVKQSCATVITTKTTAKEFNTKFDLAVNWCTK